MAWDNVGKGGGKNPNMLEIAPNTTKLMHILLKDNEEPVSYWTHYIPSKVAKGPKGAVVICPGRDVCPACADGTFRTKRVHAINVWDYENKTVKILEGGNSIFQALKQIKDQIGSLLTVDISIKKSGEGMNTKYSVVPIPMMSPFDISKAQTLFDIVKLKKQNSPEEIDTILAKMSGVEHEEQAPAEEASWGEETPAPEPSPATQTPTQTTGSTILAFGKYKGKTMADVYKEDPNYVKWCAENMSDPKIKAEAKRCVEGSAEKAPVVEKQHDKVLTNDTLKEITIRYINEAFSEDERYKGNFALIIEKMKEASKSPTHPNGKTILAEYTIDELKKLEEIIK